MLLVIVAILCIVSVPFAGGRLHRLADLEVRSIWTVIALGGDPDRGHLGGAWRRPRCPRGTAPDLLRAVAWFVFANRHLVGMPLIALGAGLNVLAISVNGGVMPAAKARLRIAGIDTSGGFANSAAFEHPRLLFLGDVIPVPGPWPIGNVLSVGDLIIVAGALILLHVTCRSRLATSVPVSS